MAVIKKLKSPLFTTWQEQYVKLTLDGIAVGDPLSLRINGTPAPFQYTGMQTPVGAEVMVLLGFEKGEEKTLEFAPADVCNTDLTRKEITLSGGAEIGVEGRRLAVAAPQVKGDAVTGPWAAFAGHPMQSTIHCSEKLQSAGLVRTSDGPLFIDYELTYAFAGRREYTVRVRCYKKHPTLEVSERFSLGMYGAMQWTWNPEKAFDSILSHRGPDFEGEAQPVVEMLGIERPRDVLCRLQMPVLSEYFVPNNRGYFAFLDSRNEDRGMIGVLGLYGARWERPVENIPEVLDNGGRVQWNASLVSGSRYWLLYAGPVEKQYSPERLFIFHRLHAEFNALRLDEHLDLAGGTVFDASCWNASGFFVGENYHEQAKWRAATLQPLRKTLEALNSGEKPNLGGHGVSFEALLDPTPEKQKAVYDYLIVRFEKWVRQFQGYREGKHDYMKNVIGFSRWLRGMLIAYELLRKDGCLTDEQVRTLNAYFVFAARRIRDEGRWPHSRTTLHPSHPESIRDVYAYGGEHKPDRLVWTNCLPNFQSDPMCALAHLSAVFADHPDAPAWRRFALDDIDRQLTAYCGKSGAWEESINYALYTYSYFIITFRVLKQRLAIDYFQDDRMRRYTGWLCRFFGPYDKRVDAYTWPGIGNSQVPSSAGHYLLAYAGELAESDPLRADCMAIYQKQEKDITLGEYYAQTLAAMAPIPDREYPIRPLQSEHMDEMGVAMRHNHPSPNESYLFQKIGFWKDHYEGDETAFNWYAKGTPLAMDYGTYTPDVGDWAAHNVVEIPEMDPLWRGYLAGHLLSPLIDYTHSEVPVMLKLLWGRPRSFEEIEETKKKLDGRNTPFFYIGDNNPVGPKVWKTRLLLFVKPDYLALFDRVYGDVPHRYNLHSVADSISRNGGRISAAGRFDLDLLCLVQHPAEFDMETGELIPNYGPADKPEVRLRHKQSFFRIYNRQDGIYRTLLFAKERNRDVRLEPVGRSGMKIVTPEYTDYVFLHNDEVEENLPEVSFVGRSGWIRRTHIGEIQACVPDGEMISAFGIRIEGRGPWIYNMYGNGLLELAGGPPRTVHVKVQPQ